jgi:hypothetical protein
MTLVVWAHAAIAFAQGKQEEAPTSNKSYVISYMVVVLAVALGLLVVCRTGSRAKEPKLDLE